MGEQADCGMETAERWICRGEALERLGVKTQTLYAYVSRGRITARPDPANPRRSLYAAEDVARLTGQSSQAPTGDDDAPMLRPAPAAARGEALVRSSLSTVVDGRLFYSGRDALQLAQSATLEEAARLLWNAKETDPFRGLKPRLAVGGVTARIRLFAALSRRAEEDATSLDRPAEALASEAASVLDEVVDAIAGVGPRLHFHQRLGRAWRVVERDNPLIRRALVLACDHGLDAAVLATRAAAGGGASPAGGSLAGMAAFVASPAAVEMNRITAYVLEARRDPAGAAVRRWTDGGAVPGFDDLWTGPDPRATALLGAVHLPADLAAVLREGQGVSGKPPTFSLALALVARRLDLTRDGAFDLMLIGRLAGLLGHALDQITDGSPIAARLRYVGPRPGSH